MLRAVQMELILQKNYNNLDINLIKDDILDEIDPGRI